MTNRRDETNEEKTNMEQLKEDAAVCGPGCNCSAGAAGRGRWVLGAIVIVVAAILVARVAMKDSGVQAQSAGTEFALTQSAGAASAEVNASGSESKAVAETKGPHDLANTAASAPLQDAEAPSADVNAPEPESTKRMVETKGPHDLANTAASAPLQDAEAPSADVNAPEPESMKRVAETNGTDDLAKTAAQAASQETKGHKQEGPVVCGELIQSLRDLNQKAMDKDGVFVFLAGQDAARNREIASVVEKDAETLGGRNIKIGTFTLESGSSEFTNFSKRVSPPCVLAMVKGRGSSAVRGDITEAKLMQAFVTAGKPRGGCGSKCGTSGCK